ncbi:MAG: hypothetical protein GWO24_00020, partial [Akkermansiaceae bacterium]|nr:hypothetical protein [Akkermansiaceae bacterium]
MNTFRKSTEVLCVVSFLAGQSSAEQLSDTGLVYTYAYAAGTTIAGPGADDEKASPSVLNDGFFTSQADIDADAGTVGGYYVNGGENNGVIFGTGPGNNRSITVDLGSVQDLLLVDMYYSVHGPFAVDAPWQVDVVIDGGAPISFNPFNISPTSRVGAPPRGDARVSTIDLTGQSGQIIELVFYSDGRTDLAGGGAQSCCGGEWTGMNEIVFNPGRATPPPAGV